MPKPPAGTTFASPGMGPFRSPPRRRKRLMTSERGLGLAGLALAVGCGAFASYMIADTDRQPHFSGAEYLTVFAKLTPSGRGTKAAPGSRQPDLDAKADTKAQDDLVTGSVLRNDAPGSAVSATVSASARIDAEPLAAGAPSSLTSYVLRSARDGAALVDSPDGLREVKRGTILPVAGLVTSIEQRDGKWVVVTSGGLIREARQ